MESFFHFNCFAASWDVFFSPSDSLSHEPMVRLTVDAGSKVPLVGADDYQRVPS